MNTVRQCPNSPKPTARWRPVEVVALALWGLLGTADLFAQADRLSLRMSDVLTTGSAPPAAISARFSMKDYRIGAEDLLEIQVFGVDQLSRAVRVNSRGLVTLPLIGAIEVAGMTAQEAESAIAARLAENFLQNPQGSLFIKEYTTQRVTIEGAVNKPGIYPLRGQTTLLRSLAVAGGQASLSDMREVVLLRDDGRGKRETL